MAENNLSKWDNRFIQLAQYVSEWSKDPNSKVGAVVSTDQGAIALGYNGFPVGIDDDGRLKQKHLKNDMIIHAEQNALLIAGTRADGASIYVWGKPICARCAAVIIQSGIKRIISISPDCEKEESPWHDLGVRAMLMFAEVGMKTTIYEPTTYKS